MFLVQALFDGVLLGIIYAIMSLGLSLTLDVMGIVNVAHSVFIMLGSFLAFELLRTFAIDPSGRLLIATSIQPMALSDGSTLPAALVLYRIGDDGRLTFARKYDIDVGRFMQFWTGIVTLP